MNLSEVKGSIFDIQRFSIHDGPGIRTNVFMKGCPLSCIWCHNPESHEEGPEIAFYAGKCSLCGACTALCPERRHVTDAGSGHAFDRDGCRRCGKCTEKCYYDTLTVIGKTVTAGEALAEVMKDEPFYKNSGGGMTLTGGEPFYQPEFSLALLRISREAGLHNCVETCGAVDFEILKDAACWTDLFLYDIKETDSQRHREYTGIPNELIIENLKKLDSLGAQIELRCPVIPGINDREQHFERLGALADSLRNAEQLVIEPYHPLGVSKSEAIGKPAAFADKNLPDKGRTEEWADALRKRTSKQVVIS